jgi:hypothetical protein
MKGYAIGRIFPPFRRKDFVVQAARLLQILALAPAPALLLAEREQVQEQE